MMRRCAVLAGLLVGLLTTNAAPAATTAAEVEEDHSLSTQVVTPHKEWSRGQVGGPLRALFFVYAGGYGGEWDEPGMRLREVIELGQRFDLQADAVLYASASGGNWAFHGGKLGEDRAERLLAQPYPLYVIAGFPFEKLPTRMRYEILAQVAQGAGLLLCHNDPCSYLTEKRRIDPTPAELTAGLPRLDGKAPSDVVSGYRLRDGRAAWLRYPAFALTPNIEFSWRGLIDYDYRMLWVGRAALWAAGRNSGVRMAGVGGDEPAELGREGGQIAVELAGSGGATIPVTVDLTLRRPRDGAVVKLPEARAEVPPEGTVSLPVTIPKLRADEYYLDAVVRGKDGVVACGAGIVTVTSPYGIGEVALEASFVEVGELLRGTVSLVGEPPPGTVLRTRYRDSDGRVVVQQDTRLAAGQTTVPLAYTPTETNTIEMRVEALLLNGRDDVAIGGAMFTVPKRRHGQMNFVIWDTPRDVLGHYAWQKLRQAGWNVCLIGTMGGLAKQPAAVRAADVSLVPYSTRILDSKDPEGHMLPVCWNDEPAVDEYVQKIVDNQRLMREQGVFVYSLGDEGVTLGCCTSDPCLAAYRRWLRTQYPDIAALNRSWGSDYDSFDAVQLLDPNDNMESAARTTAPARWFDRQAFARYNLMQFSGRFVKAYRELDPEGLTGFEGTGGFGDDYDAICGINTFYGPYPSLGDDIVRSIYPRDRVRSNWMGYSKTADALSDAAWRMVMKGMDSIWWWMWDGIGTYRGYIRPTIDFWPATEELTAELRPVRHGLGDLLLNAEPTHSGIAVFYSVAAALAGQIEHGNTYAGPAATHDAWAELTWSAGRDFRYLTSAALLGGQLTNTEFKVLLLPTIQALGEGEAAAIRRFVEAGGSVIADLRPGVLDGHCKPQEAGALDDVFGIRRTGRGPAVQVEASGKVELDGRALDLGVGKVKVDPDVEPAGATALAQLGERPAFLVHAHGRGRAILLNFQLPPEPAETAEAAAERALVRGLYEAVGARSPVTVAAPNGAPVPYIETRVWRNGDGLVFGTYRKMRCAWFNPGSGTTAGEPVPVRIDLPANRHVYDLRGGKYLGKVGRVDTRLRWGRANFYALLPYRLPTPEVTLSSRTPARGSELTAVVRMDVPQASRAVHAVWVELVDPSGRKPLWGQRVVLVRGGRGTAVYPIAHNDAAGAWRVRATELFGNQTGEARYELR